MEKDSDEKDPIEIDPKDRDWEYDGFGIPRDKKTGLIKKSEKK